MPTKHQRELLKAIVHANERNDESSLQFSLNLFFFYSSVDINVKCSSSMDEITKSIRSSCHVLDSGHIKRTEVAMLLLSL